MQVLLRQARILWLRKKYDQLPDTVIDLGVVDDGGVELSLESIPVNPDGFRVLEQAAMAGATVSLRLDLEYPAE